MTGMLSLVSRSLPAVALAVSVVALALVTTGGRGSLQARSLRIGDPASGRTYEISVGRQGGFQVAAAGQDGATRVCFRPAGSGRLDVLVDGKRIAAVGVSGEDADEMLLAITGSILVNRPRGTLNTIVWPGEVRVIGGLGWSKSFAIEGVSEGEFEEEK